MAFHLLVEAEHLIVCLPMHISIWEANTNNKTNGRIP